MIPRRVKLSGFLCYKDEQEIAFDGSSLWMLAGLNGSGKSTIFDAVTYALFGHHRGGATSAGELINKDSKSLSVEFDFLCDGQLYRIQRTLRRDSRGSTKGTQNVFRHDHATGRWPAVPDTNLSDGFKSWVREHIGLNYETFTSSVLLLQGRAERLLDSGPKDRAAVLAGIVDLERYQKLHEKADAKRKAFKANLEAVQGQISGVPEVTDLEMIAIENNIDEAQHLQSIAAAEVERLRNLEFESRQWTELIARQRELKLRCDKAQALLTESPSIEKAFKRLRELKEVIPHLLVIQEKQQALAESERASKQYGELKDQSVARQGEIEHTLDTARKKRSSYQKTLMLDEERLEAVKAQRNELAGPLSQLGIYEEQSKTLKVLDQQLLAFRADPSLTVRELQSAFDRCVELGAVSPLLSRFASARLQLREATHRRDELLGKEQATREAGEHARAAHAKLKADLEAATITRHKTDEAATTSRTLLQQATNLVDEFEKLEGAKICRACGQPLTPAHWQAERSKRLTEQQEAKSRFDIAIKAQTAAIAAEKKLRGRFETADHELQRLREEYRDAKKEREVAGKEIERLAKECRDSYLQLPNEYQVRIASDVEADWLATTFPIADELREIKKDASELDAIRRQLQEAQQSQAKYEKLRVERSTAQSLVDQIKAKLATGKPEDLRLEEKRLKGEEEALNLSTRGTRKLIQETEQEIDHLNKKHSEVTKLIADLDSQLNVEEANRIAHQDAIDRANRLIPPSWQAAVARAGLAEQNRWKTELESLERDGAESRYEELTRTRASFDVIQHELDQISQAIANVKEEAQRPPEEIKNLIAAARQTVTDRTDALQKYREDKAVLDRHRQERERLRGEILQLEKNFSQMVVLSQLLGRDRLQRHLVRTAERQIVDYANGILDRLSGGQLFLRLCGNDDGSVTERALELEAYNRTTGSTPINVAFLSGSQRFRVAVSLALGIGQYASRQHRPIESVIIDEGFGCLDRNGRQVMIQELQNLRGHLQCILLVSHQEEFADAFSDGYRFELHNGSTRITRFQR